MSKKNESTTRDLSTIIKSNAFGVKGEQVRPNRFTKFTEAQLEKARKAGVLKQLATLYGVKEDELITSSGKLVYKGPEHSRGVLDKIKTMSDTSFKKYNEAMTFLCLAVGWTERRIRLARSQGAGPVRKGWAGVHAARKAAV